MLERFWHGMAAAGRFSPIRRSPLHRPPGARRLDDSPSYALFDWLT